MREGELLPFQSLFARDKGKEQEENSRRVEAIGRIVKYGFNDPTILQQAFTHYSYEEGCSSLERLAYIGDAILTFAVTKDQCLLYPDLDPGRLTRLRAANVDTEKLARVALKHELHKFLRHNIFLLGDQIEEFRDEIAKYPLHSSGLVDAPKVLADMFEALVGAIFLDCKCSLDTTWQAVKKLLEPIITPETLPVHPVTLLQELCQSRRLSLKMRDSWKDDGAVEFVIDETCVGRAEYKAKRVIAKNRAALVAYNQFVGELDARTDKECLRYQRAARDRLNRVVYSFEPVFSVAGDILFVWDWNIH